jgi:hypothetical protein
MSTDEDIGRWLESEGFGLESERQRARAALEAAGLTRAGKQRLSSEKFERARDVLHSGFARHCSSPGCRDAAAKSGRPPSAVSDRRHCETCGGSDNGRAEKAFLDACVRKGVRKLVIVGGSPAVRQELTSKLDGPLELRLVDGTERRTADRAKSDVDWADLILVWGASELHHKVSRLYTQVPPAQKRKVLHIVKRGVAALLDEAMRHLG